MALAAASFDTRVRIERRDETDDGAGNPRGDWHPFAIRWAAFRPQFGREAVAAGRLQATRAGVVTLRRDPVTADVRTDDRLVFTTGPESGSEAEIRSILPLADRIEITVEIGVAT